MQNNPILQMLQSGNQNPQSNIMMQAFGAMMRGETPQSFLQNLAKNTPELQGLDLSDPNKAAEKLYSDRGQDISQAKASLKDRLNNFFS